MTKTSRAFCVLAAAAALGRLSVYVHCWMLGL